MTMDEGDIHIKVQASKAAAWFFVGFVGLIGLAFFLGGLAGLFDNPDADGVVLVLLGAACLFLATRLGRHFLLPRMTVGADQLVVRPFWGGTVVWPFATAVSWSTRRQLIEKSWRGRRLPIPITIERLVRTDQSGKEHVLVLPGFAGQNERMLKAIAQRSGKPVTAD
ncbi:MAG: hypothetical protein WD046_13640 [Paracoccaceae bacterium]